MAEEIHGEWQHMPAELAGLADDDAASPDSDAAIPDSDTALAIGGEGAAELEATAPADPTDKL